MSRDNNAQSMWFRHTEFPRTRATKISTLHLRFEPWFPNTGDYFNPQRSSFVPEMGDLFVKWALPTRLRRELPGQPNDYLRLIPNQTDWSSDFVVCAEL
jgi:hypothetical protein